ncbi:hypothetical protein VNO78_13069 [Psophocarpus tetragonolobus]|uniref:Uncharacterized protein n=1 Tax=Psophocarpus tetragonolobus TaxID=3891 RepID=A0AAN9SPX2_PSOTE
MWSAIEQKVEKRVVSLVLSWFSFCAYCSLFQLPFGKSHFPFCLHSHIFTVLFCCHCHSDLLIMRLRFASIFSVSPHRPSFSPFNSASSLSFIHFSV